MISSKHFVLIKHRIDDVPKIQNGNGDDGTSEIEKAIQGLDGDYSVSKEGDKTMRSRNLYAPLTINIYNENLVQTFNKNMLPHGRPRNMNLVDVHVSLMGTQGFYTEWISHVKGDYLEGLLKQKERKLGEVKETLQVIFCKERLFCIRRLRRKCAG